MSQTLLQLTAAEKYFVHHKGERRLELILLCQRNKAHDKQREVKFYQPNADTGW